MERNQIRSINVERTMEEIEEEEIYRMEERKFRREMGGKEGEEGGEAGRHRGWRYGTSTEAMCAGTLC